MLQEYLMNIRKHLIHRVKNRLMEFLVMSITIELQRFKN